jgi:Na+-translocating ferredoxin:NAD+ oxidoreductase subunit B
MSFRGEGSGSGSGRGMGGGYGRNRTNLGLGPSGNCVCPKCGTEVSHKRGVPCYEMKCPNCGSTLARKELNSSNFRGGMASTLRKEENISHFPYPKVDKEKCIACGNCIDACPFDAIEINNGSAEIIEEKCQKCNKCISACPTNAIKI